jgi:hypothetical protein
MKLELELDYVKKISNLERIYREKVSTFEDKLIRLRETIEDLKRKNLEL